MYNKLESIVGLTEKCFVVLAHSKPHVMTAAKRNSQQCDAAQPRSNSGRQKRLGVLARLLYSNLLRRTLAVQPKWKQKQQYLSSLSSSSSSSSSRLHMEV
ncbi:hypothetical protein PHSY_005144 [Pseudozyma hubeiensis SY62]|uniref:Uncharacterized protein n=1 Tax=Pseudozyma hubeiensis (strain SY62) TaxID=1305764 RepID=R9P833_PSEHS|nr:hypothetical protein PHSY_005144 [Pseudozyma hubeiensis SY62]GAC97558.1 hypothetical protein PHSY_005144 [Pseudozyma hubeiensis SY62]